MKIKTLLAINSKSLLFFPLLFIPCISHAEQLPGIFEANNISTGFDERDMAISPDGKEMFYTIMTPRNLFSVIVYRKRIKDSWSAAKIALFSGLHADLEPAFSPDGNKLFFVSKRPIKTSENKADYDIWYVEKKTDWSKAIHAGNIINSSDNEFYPSITADGSVYFTVLNKDSQSEDIVKSQYKDGQFQKPVSIGGGVNTALDEFNAFINPAERFIIFSALKGEGDNGRGELYISYRNSDGIWSIAKNLGENINSPSLDYCPFVHNGVLYFSSNRPKEVSMDSKKLDYQTFSERVNSWGNGLGDIYTVNFDQFIQQP